MSKSVVSEHEPGQVTYKAYIFGFVLSLIFTLSAYALVINHLLSKKWSFVYIIAGLALAQFVTQMTLFLHLGSESKPKFRLLIFSFMALIVIILVGGSIWIMQNLNNRMVSPSQINTYLQSQSGGL